MLTRWFGRIARGLRKPPRILVHRLLAECSTELDRYRAAARAASFDRAALLRATDAASLDALWQRLAEQPYLAHTARVDPELYEKLCPGEAEPLLAAAERALRRQIDLLGSGPLELGRLVDWSRDYKTGTGWESGYAPRMSYINWADDSDVKVPWEISRLQWLIPCGQAYLLSHDERHATAARELFEEWISANPYARGVSWACTMEVALRLLSWTWFFHVFCRSQAWEDAGFRLRFLSTLFLQADYTERHLELSDVNGNHFTADVAGLVFAGLFFGNGRRPQRWLRLGWKHLCAELPRQVFSDGVDYEGSIAYHRLVLELFLLPALYRRARGLEVDPAYRERLVAMAQFTQAYNRSDGRSPLVGDADDARALPLGSQAINDHRYLPAVVGLAWEAPELLVGFSGPRSEIFWLLGPSACMALDRAPPAHRVSKAFARGGFYLLANDRDHVFLDCGPVGLAGRGGHGHNDCLAFEAVLDGELLISDCGTYLYTASAEERIRFRSTAYHNTPQIDGEEINRFVAARDLWHLHDDAQPEVRLWRPGPERDLFRGTHSGYRRLPEPVTPVRTVLLDHERHSLVILDAFEGQGKHRIEVPLHLAPGVEAEVAGAGRVLLRAGERHFSLDWSSPDEWALVTGAGRVSPSYGVVRPTVRLSWQRTGSLDPPLLVTLSPLEQRDEDPIAWAKRTLAAAGA